MIKANTFHNLININTQSFANITNLICKTYFCCQ